MIKIVNFDTKYLDDVLKIWNERLYEDMMDQKRFTKIILSDPNFDETLSTIAIVDEEVVGFIWAIRRKFPYLERGTEPHRGFINAIVVKKLRQKIGTTLLQDVESKFEKQGVKEITLGAYSPNYIYPGVDINHYEKALHFFRHHNYQGETEAVSMQRSLFNYRYPEFVLENKQRLEKEGYTFRDFEYKDAMQLMNFLHENFGAGWKQNVQNALNQETATDTLQLVFDKTGKIQGYCQRAIDGTDTRFGPFGVSESLRSKGLGSVLFHNMLSSMKQKGITHVYFLWTSGLAIKFYERQGMSIYRTYKLLRKEIGA